MGGIPRTNIYRCVNIISLPFLDRNNKPKLSLNNNDYFEKYLAYNIWKLYKV